MIFLLFIGGVVLALWIAQVVGRVTFLEVRLAQLEASLERATQAAPAARPVPVVSTAPASSPIAPSVVSAAPVVRETAVPSPIRDAILPEAPTLAIDDTASRNAWELVVGGNWLNKIGVLIFVMGLALLVGYSMAHVGPAGRIAIGFAVSLSLLGAGIVMERRDDYRTYAYGLIAGGWAGTYFTTYAMRAVDAARVIDSDVVAIALLAVVAAGMVAQSLRYRSQVVTALAYVVAYATLALTPLGSFALVASVPLALSMLFVAQRFGWPVVQLLGVVCTYALYVVRGQVFGFGELDLTTFAPYAALAVYWLLFEAADLMALHAASASTAPAMPLFLLNAAGLVGSALLQLPMDTPVPLSVFLSLSGAAYLGSAIVRSRMLRDRQVSDDPIRDAAFGSHQGAAAVAALLVGWAIELRFTGSRRTVALLFEAEMLFLSGLILREWVIRTVGSLVAIVVSLHAIQGAAGWAGPALMWSWSAQGALGAAALTALVWLANREWLRSRTIAPQAHEWAYSPIATYLVVLIARAELPDGYSALAVLLFALVLLEAGLRRGREYRYEAYVAGASAAMVLGGWFLSHAFFIEPPTTLSAWRMLVPAIVALYLAAWRLVPRTGIVDTDRRERVIAAAIAETLGTACVVELQWMVLDPVYVGAAWALTAAVIGGIGLNRKVSGLRWQAYPLVMLALLRVMRPILEPAGASALEIASAVLVIGLLYIGSLAVRRALAHMSKALADIEDAVRIGLSLVATMALAAVTYNELRPTLITVTWGVQGIALLATGFPARERLMRLSGLGVLAACIVRLFGFDLPQLEALARIISFVALGAFLLGVSWVYTRYREQIQKFL